MARATTFTDESSSFDSSPSSPPQFAYDPERVRGEAVPGNTKPSLTTEEAAQQIARYGISLAGEGVLHQPVTVTYSFRWSSDGVPDGSSDFSRFTAVQMAATQMALASWADVAGITFVRFGTGSIGSQAYSDAGTILFGNYSTSSSSAAAFAFLPGDLDSSSIDSDVWVDIGLDYNATPVRGDYGQQVLTHEIGHALGLQHPSDYNAGDSTAEITYEANASYFEDSRQYSIMSYFGGVNTGAAFPAFSATPGMDDIAAIQLLYGANMNTRTGDTVYGFNSNADQVWFQSVAADGSDLVFCAWDAGGVDTFDFSGYALDAFIDLRAGHFSNVGTGVANVSIAVGATIENAKGGTGADRILGNEVDNQLFGGAGNDQLEGGLGADTLDGGSGDDTFYVDSSLDTVVEAADAGIDAVVAAVSLVLGDNVEGLTLTGSADLTGTGNALNNSIGGNSGNNMLWGGAGDDTLTGGAGNDTYDIDSVLDVIVEGSGGGTDQVLSSVSWTLGFAVENLTLQGSANLSGAGNGSDNILLGNSGNNSLSGSAGNDTLDGGTGQDRMQGGTGNDTFFVDNTGDRVIETNNQGVDIIFTTVTFGLTGLFLENQTLLGSDNISALGNGFANVLTGNSGANVINGGRGDDIMTGGAGNDLYFVDTVGDQVIEASGGGRDAVNASITYSLVDNVETLVLIGYQAINGTGNDLDNALTGNGNVNVLIGGGGKDVFHGLGGNDILTGGDGADVFAFSRAGAANGLDRLTDFVSGQDHLAFVGTDYGFTTGQILTSAQVHTGNSVGAFGQFLYNPANHILYWDADGTGATGAVAVAVFDNGVLPVASDFIIQ